MDNQNEEIQQQTEEETQPEIPAIKSLDEVKGEIYTEMSSKFVKVEDVEVLINTAMKNFNIKNVITKPATEKDIEQKTPDYFDFDKVDQENVL